MRYSVVIPMYNERAVIAASLSELAGTMEKAARERGWEYEILLSDDGSDDGCGEIARKTAEELNLTRGIVKILRAEKNRGKGAAVRSGMLAASGDWRLFTDSDLAYGAEIVPVMLDAALEDQNDPASPGCALLIGSRAIGKDGYAGYGLLRTAASRAYLKLLSLAAGLRCTDSQCGIKLIRRDAAEAIFSRCETDGWAFDCEVLLLASRLGFPVREYPARVLKQGKTKIRLIRDSVGMAGEVARIHRRLASREKDAQR